MNNVEMLSIHLHASSVTTSQTWTKCGTAGTNLILNFIKGKIVKLSLYLTNQSICHEGVWVRG
jgi:hypothetical protein